METPLDNLITGFEGLEAQLNEFGQSVLASNGFLYTMLNLNREQMEAGRDALGGPITLDGSTEYRPLTVEIKTDKGQPTDRITLQDTGQFYNNLRAEVEDGGVVFSDTDLKTFSIVERTGEDIFGLTDENLDRVKDLLRPVFEGEIRNIVVPQLLAR